MRKILIVLTAVISAAGFGLLPVSAAPLGAASVINHIADAFLLDRQWGQPPRFRNSASCWAATRCPSAVK
jgi:hypothetical protein